MKEAENFAGQKTKVPRSLSIVPQQRQQALYERQTPVEKIEVVKNTRDGRKRTKRGTKEGGNKKEEKTAANINGSKYH